jgi:hypothetical protein
MAGSEGSPREKKKQERGDSGAVEKASILTVIM